MSTACIIIADTDDGNQALSVVYDGGMNNKSPAHAAIRRLVEIIDTMGVEIIEPTTVILDANGHDIGSAKKL